MSQAKRQYEAWLEAQVNWDEVEAHEAEIKAEMAEAWPDEYWELTDEEIDRLAEVADMTLLGW